MTASLFANANTDWVDAQIQAIKPPRSGVSHRAINSVKNPFIYVYKKTENDGAAGKKGSTTTDKKTVSPSKVPLKLSAVMNNSALINGTWYQVKDKVRGYSLEKIEQDSVLLQSGKAKKVLFITDANPNIKIQIK